ncbi:MetI-like domain [Moorella glycerini]|uniref:Inner membrane ABC transporter permease protein YcjO n=1 Tax=Neomoorella stamsii TaxID=1266720 RepID=A0A9X7P7B3_9FIRM|nr:MULTISPECIES: sugar ABC transporter permease [Moorella]PRR76451.1 Inner membrane ABC transporter permease protein YcjO [Moorella stamsii]CEP66980.1 MetI-like domain [Moorella glycerini]
MASKPESMHLDGTPGSKKASIWVTLTNEKNFKWTLLIPLLAILLVFAFYPLFYSIYLGFHDWGMEGKPIFSGLKNYRQLVHDPVFWAAFGRTIKVMVICIACELILGMGVALLWNREFRGQNVIRALALIPLLVAPLILSLLWYFMLDYNFGAVNLVLAAIGMNKVNWFSPEIALYTICFITIWQWFPFSAFVLLAGLKSIPRDVLEAARVDGASGFYTFRRVVLPMLRPLIMIIIVLRAMWLIRLMDPLFGTTRGGVNTELLDWIVYRTAFVMFDLGYGSSMAIVSLAVTIALCMVMFRELMKAIRSA